MWKYLLGDLKELNAPSLLGLVSLVDLSTGTSSNHFLTILCLFSLTLTVQLSQAANAGISGSFPVTEFNS